MSFPVDVSMMDGWALLNFLLPRLPAARRPRVAVLPAGCVA